MSAIIPVAVVVLLLMLFWIGEWLCTPTKQIPGISDEEFMARLPRGTDREIALKVRTIVAKQTGVKREYILPDTKFVDL